MRVVNASMYQKFGSAVNDVHYELNKSMNKISSGKAYENAAQNPLAYYEGKKIDNQYQDTLSKMEVIKNLQSRLYEQEQGARSIQSYLRKAESSVSFIRSDSNNGDMTTVDTKRQELLQYAQMMVNDLNAQYQNYYVYGGNDVSTPPFSLSADGRTLTFTHQYPGEANAEKIVFELQNNGEYKISGTPTNPTDKMLDAMMEQGRVDVGYGTITERETLLDTFTNGLNLLTGLNADSVKAMVGNNKATALAEIQDRLNKSPLGLTTYAAMTCDRFEKGEIDKDEFSETLGHMLDEMTLSEHRVSTVYSDLGNKYATLEATLTKLTNTKQSLTEQYTNKLGADPYESIMQMFAYQTSYSAAMQVSSRLMQNSLFDFIR